MEIKRNSTTLFSGGLKVEKDKNANRKSLKLSDEKNIFSKLVASVRRSNSNNKLSEAPPATLDKEALDKLDAYFAQKDEDEHEHHPQSHTTVQMGSQRLSKNLTVSNDNNPSVPGEDTRMLSKRASVASLPNYTIKRAERKDTSMSEGPMKTIIENSKFSIRSKRSNSRESSGLSPRGNREDSKAALSREYSQIAVSSRLPSTLLPPLVINHAKRHKHSNPSSASNSPALSLRPGGRGPKSKSNGDIPYTTVTKAEENLNRMNNVVNNAGF